MFVTNSVSPVPSCGQFFFFIIMHHRRLFWKRLLWVLAVSSVLLAEESSLAANFLNPASPLTGKQSLSREKI